MELTEQIKKGKISLFDNKQIAWACAIINEYLGGDLLAIHLYGSAIEGGLKPYSDIDLFVTIDKPMDYPVRVELMRALLACSAAPGTDPSKRALEVTVVSYGDIKPWKYPPKREMQFGEWLRTDILAGVFESSTTDIDLCIILKKLRTASIAIVGAEADVFFEAVPDQHFMSTLRSTLAIWQSEEDWVGDERNIVLTVARIWYSATTGEITSKEEASLWLLDRLPFTHRSLVMKVRQDYLTGSKPQFSPVPEDMVAFMSFAKQSIAAILQV